jgi:thiamine kinase-like enzyme
VAGPGWIDGAGYRARDRLQAGASEAVIGHCDWLAGNLRWSGGDLLVVHDWDSVTATDTTEPGGLQPVSALRRD